MVRGASLYANQLLKQSQDRPPLQLTTDDPLGRQRQRREPGKLILAMSRPIVVIVCMVSSSESWRPQQRPHQRHSRGGGGAVHSIITGSQLMYRSPRRT